ncbi:MAG: hypothetical protein JSV03_04825 [Planctomycetota bacterium]|nr:MAG: hypothetical protein JSV03_04825 [Planctomycetota bacterium]
MRYCRHNNYGQIVAIIPITLWLLGLAICGCRSQSESAPKTDTKAKPIVKKVQRGPVNMILRADQDQITIADKIKLTIEVEAEDGVEVEMPAFGDKLDEFQIRDFKEWSAIPDNGSRRWKQEYVLDIYLSGDYNIPAITTKFTDKRKQATEGGDEGVVEGELASEPFTIKVASLLEGEFDPTKFCDIKGPVELTIDRTWKWLWWTGGTILALVILVVGIWWLLRHAGKIAKPVVLTPHEWALDQLHWLADDNLIEKGRFQEFYYRLSDIIRQYIERRFHIMAPEQTTEEFLVDLKNHPALKAEYKHLLREFLRAADLVKFARYQPEASEADQAYDSARDFVEQTAQTQEDTTKEAAA